MHILHNPKRNTRIEERKSEKKAEEIGERAGRFPRQSRGQEIHFRRDRNGCLDGGYRDQVCTVGLIPMGNVCDVIGGVVDGGLRM